MMLFDDVPVQPIDTDERFTPAWVFDGLSIEFDLDPCSPIAGGDCVPARNRYTALDDGLAKPWNGNVWVNPPFSNAAPWADRFIGHRDGIWLGPVANARWCIDLIGDADLLWFTRDFAFTHPTHAGKRSSMPLMFAAIGGPNADALRRLHRSGRHVGRLLVSAA